ncbi:MAG: signal transduction histidine kinase [Bacteroidia bacterium]
MSRNEPIRLFLFMIPNYIKTYFTILLFLVWLPAKAQLANTDSLLEVFKNAISNKLADSILAKTSYQVAQAYEKAGAYNDAIKYYQKAGSRFRFTKNYQGHFNSLKREGIMSWRTSKYEKALKLYARAQNLAESNQDSAGISSCLNNAAIIYWVRSNHLKAIQLFQQALEITKAMGNRNNEARTIGNIGMIYLEQENLSKALDAYQEALTILEELKDQAGISIFLANAANVYVKYGMHQKALNYYTRALEIQKELNDKKVTAACLNDIGFVYFEMKDFKKSEKYFLEALALEKEIENEIGESPSLNGLARIELQKKNYAKALKYANQSYEISTRYGLISEQTKAYELLSEIYEYTGNQSKALTYFKQYITLKDSVLNKKNNEQLARIEAEFDFKKEELKQESKNEKERLELQNQIESNTTFRNLMIVAFLLGVGFIAFGTIAYKAKSNANSLLKVKNKHISGQNEKITRQNEELNYTNMQLIEARMDMLEALENEREAYENLKQAEKQLIQAEKMASLGQLTAGISHEINNPLNYITGAAQVLEMNVKELKEILFAYFSDFAKAESESEKIRLTNVLEEELREVELITDIETVIPSLKEGSTRIGKIINSLKTFTSDGNETPTMGNIHTDIDSTISLLGGKWKENIQFRTNYGAKIPQFYAYHSLINQMLLYLLTNAVESIQESGEIRIETRMISVLEENEVEIVIQDTGNGIPEEIKGKVFDPFFSSKEVGKGAGLGLSQVYSIVEKHDGKIRFTSEKNIGTTFYINLPTDRFLG